MGSDVRKLEKYIVDFQRKRMLFLEHTAELEKSKLREECPVDYGNLRLSTGKKINTGHIDTVKVGSRLQYAIYVNRGTGIYRIGGGGRQTPWKYFYRRTQSWIWTRGQRPQEYVKDGMKNSFPRLKQLARNIFRD